MLSSGYYGNDPRTPAHLGGGVRDTPYVLRLNNLGPKSLDFGSMGRRLGGGVFSGPTPTLGAGSRSSLAFDARDVGGLPNFQNITFLVLRPDLTLRVVQDVVQPLRDRTRKLARRRYRCIIAPA